VDRLEEHARSLAAAQPVTPKAAKGNPLGGRGKPAHARGHLRCFEAPCPFPFF
jgi:hypothetical protein